MQQSNTRHGREVRPWRQDDVVHRKNGMGSRLRTVVGPIVVALSLMVAAPTAEAVTAVVPNQYLRTCSYITHQCTGYTQVNGPHNPSVGNAYYTQWRWVWIS